MSEISRILLTAHAATSHTQQPYFGLTKSQLFGDVEDFSNAYTPCFFLNNELRLRKEYVKRNGLYHHCKIWKGKFLDYIARTEYNTIEDWARACGSDIANVLFGVHKFEDKITYIPLASLLRHIHAATPDPEVAELTRFAKKLTLNGLTLQTNILVEIPEKGIFQRYTTYMAE